MSKGPADTDADHDSRVAAIAAEQRARSTHGDVVEEIAKGGVRHVVPLPGARAPLRPLDVKGLDRIISIDAQRRVCVAEPAVPFERIVSETLRHGLLPKVVPELKGITVGGAVAGCSVESMSYQYGGFHDSCLEYELVTSAGDVMVCSPEQDPDVFHMIHGSYGTLAVLTRLTFELIPAKPYVAMRYRTLTSAATFLAAMRTAAEDPSVDFVDGIVHGPGRFVVCLGTFVDQAPYLSDYARSEIFYRSTTTRSEDYLTTQDYCFRYDADCHWMTRLVPPLEWRPIRRLLGRWLLGSTNLIRGSRRLAPLLARKARPDVVCDVFVPSRRFEDFFAWYQSEFRFYPLWIVPYRAPRDYPWISSDQAARARDDLHIDCAIYGRPNNEPGRDYSELLGNKVYELGGIKTLIGRNHYTPQRFWAIYNRPNWEAAKARLDPNRVLPDLYAKFGQVG